MSAVVVLAGVTTVGSAVAAEGGGGTAEPSTLITFTPEAVAMLGLEPSGTTGSVGVAETAAPTAPPAAPATVPAAVPTAEPAAGTATEVVTVSIQPGPLLLLDPPRTVQLRRDGDSSRFEATLSGLRVADARGSYAGWQLTMRLVRVNGQGSEGGELRVVVSRIDAFTDTLVGISASPGDLVPGGRVVLAEAAPGSGGGSFDLTLELSAELPAVHGRVVTAQLDFALA